MYLCRPNDSPLIVPEESRIEFLTSDARFNRLSRADFFSFLSPKDLSNAAQVNHTWRIFSQQEFLWENLWRLEYGVLKRPEEYSSYCEAFQQCYRKQQILVRGKHNHHNIGVYKKDIFLSGDTLCSTSTGLFLFGDRLHLFFRDLKSGENINFKGLPARLYQLENINVFNAFGRLDNHFFFLFRDELLYYNDETHNTFSIQSNTDLNCFIFNDSHIILGTHDQIVILSLNTREEDNRLSAKPLHTLRLDGGMIGVQWSGDRVCCAQYSGTILFIDPSTGSFTHKLQLDRQVSAFYIHQDRKVITGHSNGEINVWDIESRERIFRFGAGVNAITSLHSFGNILLSSHCENFEAVLSIWDIEAGRRLRHVYVGGSPFLFNDAHFVSKDRDGTVFQHTFE